MKVVPMATSSPCRVVTLVGVDRSRTFSLSKVILRAAARAVASQMHADQAQQNQEEKE